MIKDLKIDFTPRTQRCHFYVEALEEERRKIQVFRRELPLCLELVSQAIESCRRDLSAATTTELVGGQSECSVQTTGHCGGGPAFAEFIPIKRSHLANSEDDEHQSDNPKKEKSISSDDKSKKSDWLRFAQLWNQSSDQLSEENDASGKATKMDEDPDGASHPLHEEKSAAVRSQQDLNSKESPAAESPTTATAAAGGGDKESEKGAQRKQRRCWSTELHRRFLHALEQLGGSHVATPKQIKEIMNVEGLTNDEVKSHLQKYRLHTRRPTQAPQSNSGVELSAAHASPHLVVVGGIWVPQADYAAHSPTRIYAPLATRPPPTWPKQTAAEPSVSEERGSHGHHSPAASSSTYTSTAPPPGVN